MALQFGDMIKEPASNKPTAGGTFNLSGTASSGFEKFDSQITSGNQVICSATSSAGQMEFIGTYTNAATDTITVDALRHSSTGSLINFSGGDTVVIENVIDAAYANILHDSEFTEISSASVTTANVTGIVGTLHVLSCSGLTANRDFVLPANAAAGSRIGVYISSANATYALLLKPDASDTINGGSAGAEWSRLIIPGEVIIFRCITANGAWIVEQDGRIPQVCDVELTTSCDGETAATFTRPTQAATPGAWTAQKDNASLVSVSLDRITVRRSGSFSTVLSARQKDNPATGGYFTVGLYKNAGETLVLLSHASSTSSVAPTSPNVRILPLSAGDYLVFKYRSADGGLGLLLNQTWFGVAEVLA